MTLRLLVSKVALCRFLSRVFFFKFHGYHTKGVDRRAIPFESSPRSCLRRSRGRDEGLRHPLKVICHLSDTDVMDPFRSPESRFSLDPGKDAKNRRPSPGNRLPQDWALPF